MRAHRGGMVVAAGTAMSVVLLLSGCTRSPGKPPSPTVSAERGPTKAARPAPDQTPTPTVDPHPDLADLLLSTSNLGPLRVGSVPPETNPGAAMIEWDPDFCSGGPDEVPEPGRWVPAGYSPDTNVLGEQTIPFYVDASDQGVHRIDVMGIGPHTTEGIRIGSTAQDLQATYAGVLHGPFDGPVSRVWWLQDDRGALVFETQGDADGLQPAGTPERVILIRVLAPAYPPDFATANSGDVAGACF